MCVRVDYDGPVQAIAFLNAYWTEIHTQAEFIFTVAYEMMKYARTRRPKYPPAAAVL